MLYAGGYNCTDLDDKRKRPCSGKQYCFDNHGQTVRYDGPVEVAQTVTATYGTGGNNQSFVVKETENNES